MTQTEREMRAELRLCSKCQIAKPASDFYPDKRRKSGLKTRCKPCSNAQCVEYQNKHAVSIAAYRYSDEFLAKKHSSDKVRLLLQPAKPKVPTARNKARAAFRHAVRTGKIQKWPVCAVPDCSASPVGHHADYSRPLDVTWLCPMHHRDAHRIPRLIALGILPSMRGTT